MHTHIKKIIDLGDNTPHTESRKPKPMTSAKQKASRTAKRRKMPNNTNVIRDGRGRKSELRPDLYMSGIAREVGISAGYLSKLFRGTRTPSLSVARKLADCMQLSLQQLLDSLPQALPREE